MIILLHSSKTMRSPLHEGAVLRSPQLLAKAETLAAYLQTLSVAQIAAAMHVSSGLATKTQQLLAAWSADADKQSLALDSFVGDIYSGLRADSLSDSDRDYADKTLRILSGLYGVIRPYDGICQYRLEMGYRFPDVTYGNLYKFWGSHIADTLPSEGPIINVSSEEFTKTVIPFVAPERVITPKFLTVDQKTGEPTFVVVHAKIARGAFARWLIQSRTTSPEGLSDFTDIGYTYDPTSSTPGHPTFICQTFEGKGLSMKTSPTKN
jgi:cytoplasmic iron level regulating protein YaaA (DUF328/UPF0246 family)